MGMMNRRDLVAMKYKPGMVLKPTTQTGPEGARQEFREESDINVIMRRAVATGHLPVRADIVPAFADVTGIGDFADVQRRVSAARDAFMLLSPDLRFRFNNRPEDLIAFVSDDSNREEAVKLGLVAVPKVEAVVIPPEPLKMEPVAVSPPVPAKPV